jgi:hypothetical protein
LEEFVADGMSEGVVDVLETIQIQEQHCGEYPRPLLFEARTLAEYLF